MDLKPAILDYTSLRRKQLLVMRFDVKDLAGLNIDRLR